MTDSHGHWLLYNRFYEPWFPNYKKVMFQGLMLELLLVVNEHVNLSKTFTMYEMSCDSVEKLIKLIIDKSMQTLHSPSNYVFIHHFYM